MGTTTQPKFESKDQAKDLARSVLSAGKVLPDSLIEQEISNYMAAVVLYRLKLSGAIWFEGDLPDSSLSTVTVQVREVEPEVIAATKKKFFGYTRSSLAVACRYLEKPEWAE